MAYEGLQAETVKFRGHNGDMSEGYYARPSRNGRVGGVVVIHGAGGWDEWPCEVVRKLAHYGFAAIVPNLYVRFGEGSPDKNGFPLHGGGVGIDCQALHRT